MSNVKVASALRPHLAFVEEAWFELLVQFVIIVNALVSVLMAEKNHGTNSAIVTTNIFFVLYAAEAILKLLRLGTKRYFASAWNTSVFFLALAPS